MPDRSEDEKLFGAAVVLRKLERSGLLGSGGEVFKGILEDLGLSEEAVRRYLKVNSERVDVALREAGQ